MKYFKVTTAFLFTAFSTQSYAGPCKDYYNCPASEVMSHCSKIFSHGYSLVLEMASGVEGRSAKRRKEEYTYSSSVDKFGNVWYSVGCSGYYGVDDHGYPMSEPLNIYGGQLLPNYGGGEIVPGDMNEDSDCDSSTANPVNLKTGSKFFVENLYQEDNINIKLRYDSSHGYWRDNYAPTSKNIVTAALAPLGIKYGTVVYVNGVITERHVNKPLKRHPYKRATTVNYVNSQPFVYYDEKQPRKADNEVQIIRKKKNTKVDYANKKIDIQRDPTTLQPLSMTLPNQKQVSFEYDDKMRLIALDINGKTKRYRYEDPKYPRAITSVINPDGQVYKEITYHADGRVKSSSLASLDEVMTFEYPSKRLTVTTNEWGKKTKYHFGRVNDIKQLLKVEGEPSTHCLAANQAYTYDKAGRKLSQTDWNGTTTTFEYNDKGLLTKKSEGAGTSKAQNTLYHWDANRKLKATLTPSTLTRYQHDQSGNTTAAITTKNNGMTAFPQGLSHDELTFSIAQLKPTRHYTLDNREGLQLLDHSGHHNASIVLKENTQVSELIVDSSNSTVSAKYLNLAGKAYIDMGKLPKSEIENGFTWSAWVNPVGTIRYQTYFHAHNGYRNYVGQDNLALMQTRSLGQFGYISRGQDYHVYFLKENVGWIQFNQYQLLTITYKNGEYQFYINDKLEFTKKGGETPVMDRDFFTMGQAIDGKDMFKGDFQVGRIATFDRVLTEEEIIRLYQASQQ
ncbi:LamG-like jellyroll fold domain-containing protein [Algicola sagamiensis]|uniref:LamG-like jellyroll fold domain-containing protein n=1 Tax=Algicola sagamiensis TaxID=163869 RepID=UPI00036EE45B|nr:LamG-like jellyroll fold domain-containing protein [Algicola sagamiensis]